MESKIKALQGELDAEKERNKSLQSMQEKSDKVRKKETFFPFLFLSKSKYNYFKILI